MRMDLAQLQILRVAVYELVDLGSLVSQNHAHC